MRKSGESRKALSLLEILVAAIILALIIMGSMSLFVASKGRIVHSRWRITAAEAGRLFLSPFQGEVNQQNWGNNCLSNPVPSCTPVLDTNLLADQTIDNNTFTPTYQTTRGVGGVGTLNRVQVTITWPRDEPIQ